MSTNGLTSVFAKLLQARELKAELYGEVIRALQSAFPKEDYDDAGSLADRDPTDAVLHLVNKHLPEWIITLKGKAHEADGDWACTLRKSDVRDNDALIGTGAGPTLALAVLIAFIKLNVMRTSL